MLHEMKSLNKNLSLIIYTCYIKTCFTSRNFNEAVSIYNELKNKNMSFDKVTYNTLIKGFISAKMNNLLKETVCESIEKKIIVSNDPSIYHKIYKSFIYDKKFNSFGDEFLNLIGKIGLKRNIKTGQFFFMNNFKFNDEYEDDEEKTSNYLLSGYKFKKKDNFKENEAIFKDKDNSFTHANSTNNNSSKALPSGGLKEKIHLNSNISFDASYNNINNIIDKDSNNVFNTYNSKTSTISINHNQEEKKKQKKFYPAKYEDPSQFKIVKSSNFRSDKASNFGGNDENQNLRNLTRTQK